VLAEILLAWCRLAQTLGQVCAASGPGGGQAVGIELLSTHCEDTRSPVGWHLDGRAKGFDVGVYRATLDADSAPTSTARISSPAPAARRLSRPPRLSAT